jgi:AcrR family transcriptional regulator
MIIYFRIMRVRDEDKQNALFRATVKLVNEIGFAASSVSKIAREAEISPATVYIYHKNKEDLLVSTYMQIKKNLVQAMLYNFDGSLPIRDILKKVWLNLFAHISEHPADFYYMEQFANSPYTDRVDTNEIDQMLLPIVQTIQRGIDQKIIKNVNFDIISAFTYYPVYTLANRKICTQFSKNKDDIEAAFNLSWDAIKL